MNLHDLIALMTLLIEGTNISVKIQWNTIWNIQVNIFWSYNYINTSSNFCAPNLDFPRFNVDNPTRWIYRAEQYFSLHNTFDANKVSLTSFHLEHEALQWFCWYIKAHVEPNWTDFCQLLLQRFGHSSFDDFIGALTKLCQTWTVREYQTEIWETG